MRVLSSRSIGAHPVLHVLKHVPTAVLQCNPARPTNEKAPRLAGLSPMRRRGLEPPPGYPGPGPQPGASTNSAIGARAVASIALPTRLPDNSSVTLAGAGVSQQRRWSPVVATEARSKEQ